MISRQYVREAGYTIPNFLFAASLSQLYFPYDSFKFAGSFLLLSFSAYLFQTILEAQLAIALSFVSTAALTQIPIIKLLYINNPAWRIALTVLLVFVFLAALYRLAIKKNNKSHFIVEFVPAIAMFFISVFWSSTRDLGGLNFLGQSEDNAAWLMGLSFGLSDGEGIHYVSGMSWASGPVLGAFSGWIAGLMSLGLERSYVYFDNVGSLLSAFGLLLMLTVGTLMSGVLRFAKRIGSTWESLIPLSIGSFVVIYVSFTSVMRLGHYSFMVAIWLVICAIAISEVGDENQPNANMNEKIEKIKPILISALIVASAQSWLAITPAAALVCTYLIAKYAFTVYRQRLIRINSLVICISIFVSMVLIYKILGRNLKYGLEIQNLKTFFLLEGSAATVSSFLLTLFIVIPIIDIFLSQKSELLVKGQQRFLIPACMVLTFVLMMSIALPTVYGVNYVIQKFEFLLFITLVPFNFYAIAKIRNSITDKFYTLLLVVVLLMVLMYDQSLNKGFSYPGVGRSERVIWANAAENELLNYPERHVVCLNTKEPDDVHSDMAAYECNRILIGIQGLEGNDDYEDWTRLGMWLVDTSRIRSLPDSYYENMTFIIFDSDFSRQGDEVFMSALNRIPWDKVRAVDLDGTVIHGSP